jgi:ATP-dependent DNA ligase
MTEAAEISDKKNTKDLFAEKSISPMLIGETAEAFDSTDYIYELKLDGERCIAYLDPVEYNAPHCQDTKSKF